MRVRVFFLFLPAPTISQEYKVNCLILVGILKFRCLKMASNLLKQIWVHQ